MNIFLDESGSFVSAEERDSWNCIVAYMSPESDRGKLHTVLTRLKRATGVSRTNEIKLRNVQEKDYFDFLFYLGKLNGVLFTAATDSGLYSDADIVLHQEGQAAKITKHKDVMQHESVRRELEKLSDQVRSLSPQLYVQMQCQIQLISMIVMDGVLYFVQRFPKTLGRFRWRIDQKNSTRTEYEKTFFTLTPPLIQTISLKEPIPMLEGADYSAFQRFDYREGEAPTYLKTVYGIDIGDKGPPLNIGQLIRENLKFVDSKANQGIQVADLLAAGMRRCLRKGFTNNRTAARLLGSLMLKRKSNSPPVWLLGFTEAEEYASIQVEKLINIMRQNCRSILVHQQDDKPQNSLHA